MTPAIPTMVGPSPAAAPTPHSRSTVRPGTSEETR